MLPFFPDKGKLLEGINQLFSSPPSRPGKLAMTVIMRSLKKNMNDRDSSSSSGLLLFFGGERG